MIIIKQINMKIGILCLFIIIASFTDGFAQNRDNSGKDSVKKNNLIYKPTLFSNLDESFSTPDGMAIDKKNRLFLSVPNFINYEKYGSKICVFDSANIPQVWLDSLPLHPESKQAHPMGIEFGPDGNLYIADNQSSFGLNKSRLLRVIVKNGNPVKTEVLVEGFNIANGLRWNKNRIYITDSYLYNKEKNDQSGVFNFTLSELNEKKIILKPDFTDEHLLCSFTTKVFNNKHDQGGADGIVFDKMNNLYCGNFSDGVITKIVLSKLGQVVSQEIFFDSDEMRCSDGLFYSHEKNCIYIANFNNNCIHILDLKQKSIKLLWANEDDDGRNGLLDQPCEVIKYKGYLVVVNFDSFIMGKNKSIDKFHTISKIKIE